MHNMSPYSGNKIIIIVISFSYSCYCWRYFLCTHRLKKKNVIDKWFYGECSSKTKQRKNPYIVKNNVFSKGWIKFLRNEIYLRIEYILENRCPRLKLLFFLAFRVFSKKNKKKYLQFKFTHNIFLFFLSLAH